ncbi:CG4041 [Drosophila busckii]|uniref:CG4041 n=1 Tax=Drosophila busckii TaxID=30019 RepID=A0A0M4FB25_DROBS|nr:CG4041 [Drosophila busckii]
MAAGAAYAKPEPRRLCAITFFAKLHPGDVCGSNGLPLTPNSIAILGRSQRLKELHHEHLCQYLDVIRGKHERTIVVSEYVGCTLEEYIKRKQPTLSYTQILSIFQQVASGIEALHAHKLVAQNLEPRHILLNHCTDKLRVKLFNYGMYHMTKGGAYVPFPIGNIRYMAPERLLGANGNIKSDIWAWAMLMLELLLQTELWPKLKLSNIAWKLLALARSGNTVGSVLEKIAREHQLLERYQQLPSDICELLERCLSVLPAQRPLPSELLAHRCFLALTQVQQVQLPVKKESVPLLLRCPLSQIYHLWQLAGGDVQSELKKEGLIRSEAPILALPQIVRLIGASVCPARSQSYLMDERVVLLRLNPLLKRLSRLPANIYFPLLHTPRQQRAQYQQQAQQQLPLLIRERDIEYQFQRVRLFTRLLQGYPHSAELMQREAAIDIPPLLRGPIWAALLGVLPTGSYGKIDKCTATSTDRQIEVDIPRCHQYDELLSSPDGHRKLKRLLKAWVTAHPQYVYWQELAFLSLFRFIPKYLQWFFLKDNSAIIKEYLCKFSQLSAFHEPLLAQHLSNINFIPELFAIPWFLTMFSHVFPLHKILHLWDKLMLGDSSYPLFIGIAILKQLKSTLLSSGFNECILLFSDLPDIVMESCVTESQKMYESTPKSITYRTHARRTHALHPMDIGHAEIELKHLQTEQCPRISARDVHLMLLHAPTEMVLIDLRSVVEYSHVHVPHSLNIPFATVQLGDQRLESLHVPHLDVLLRGRTVVCVSNIHQHSVEFSHFLIACGVQRTCILHKGFNVLHSIEPNILISN